MDFHDVVTTRRSIRSFSSAGVDEGLIVKVLEAAMTAPSAGNQQPWQFLVVRDRRMLDGVPAFHPYCRMITKAPVAIVVCGDPTGRKWPDFWVQDCSAAVQNLLLAARNEGLGTVWTGVFPREDRMSGCRKHFSIPKRLIPFAIIPIGWPAEDVGFAAADRYRPERVHFERFDAELLSRM